MVIRLRLSVYGKECTPLLEEEAYREIDECDIEEFGTLGISEKTIAMLGDRWWPQAAKQEGGNLAKRFYVIYGSNAMSAQINVGGVSIRSRNDAPFRKGCVADGQITKTRKKMSRPLPPLPSKSLAPTPSTHLPTNPPTCK